jgi:hypothetical protein
LPEGLEPQHRSHQPLDRPVILFNDVVERLDLVDLDNRVMVGIVAYDRRRVGAILVDRDLLRALST